MEFTSPTEHELSAVVILKSKYISEMGESAYQFTDTAILRFYRGRKHDMDKAYKGMVRHVQWRNEFKVDEIQPSQYMGAYNSKVMNLGGFDKHGRPCIFIHSKNHNKNKRDLEELRYLIIHTLETVLKTTKPEEERMVICFDLSGFSYSCMDYDGVKLIIDILQYNYPETLSVAFIFNSPMLFSACWMVIKPWLDPVTAAKVMFVSESQLSSYLDANSIALMRGIESSEPVKAADPQTLKQTEDQSNENTVESTIVDEETVHSKLEVKEIVQGKEEHEDIKEEVKEVVKVEDEDKEI